LLGWTAEGGCPFDKSEGGVKDKLLLSVFFPPFVLPERLRTKTLEISR
jgi:hypothetical protein